MLQFPSWPQTKTQTSGVQMHTNGNLKDGSIHCPKPWYQLICLEYIHTCRCHSGFQKCDINLLYVTHFLQDDIYWRQQSLHVRARLDSSDVARTYCIFQWLQILPTWDECVLYGTTLCATLICLFTEVVLALLVENLEFSLAKQEIIWQMTGIVTPNTDPDSTTPTMPMMISLAK